MNADLCAVLFLTAGAAWTDLTHTRVENSWLLLWLFSGLCLQTIRAGPEGLILGLSGVAVPFLLLFPFFYFRMLGAGDIKTLAVLGTYLGPTSILPCLFYTFLFAAGLSALSFLADGGFFERIRYFSTWLTACLTTGHRYPYLRTGLREESLHMTVPILMAVLLWGGGWY